MDIWQNHNIEEKDEGNKASEDQKDYTVPTLWWSDTWEKTMKDIVKDLHLHGK